MSVPIHKGTQFLCVEVDPEGRSIFFTVLPLWDEMYNCRHVHSSTIFLKLLAIFMARYPSLPVLVIGDFNNYMDHEKDKLSATVTRGTVKNRGLTAFACLLLEVGLTDVWRMRNPDDQVYFCQSASNGGLYWIDLGMRN